MLWEFTSTLIANYWFTIIVTSINESYKSLVPNAIEEPYVLGSQVNFENLFHTIEMNPNTLKHFVWREFDKF